MKAINLKTENIVNPLGTDLTNPYLLWNYL